MGTFKDLTGATFNLLTVLRRSDRKGTKVRWVCQCRCGQQTTVIADQLTSGKTQSCGCLRKSTKNKPKAFTHGMTYSPEFSSWSAMRKRCLNKRHHAYHRYGGRGITICDEWIDSFEAFYRDMGPRPKNLTLERKDTNKGYSKENCIWATRAEQNINRRNTRLIEHDGKRLTIKEWSKVCGLKVCTINSRIHDGWDPVKAITTPLQTRTGKTL